MKKIYISSDIEDAIYTLDQAVKTLDEIINQMQKNQETIKSWLQPRQEIGWIDQNENM